jgi:TRAP-type C4-dicarboxylate transport system substrate-binding protein
MTTRLKIGGYQGDKSVHTAGLRSFVEELAAEDDSFDIDLDINVTANGIAAGALFKGTETGDFDVCYMASGYLSARVPSLDLLDVPFSITDRRQAYEALDGTVGARLRADVWDRTSLQVLAFWDNGFRHVSNSRHAIRHPSDCGGLVIRTLDNQSYQDLLSDIGFRPVVTDVKELVENVRNGSVDAQENPLTNVVNFGLHEWHRHVSLTAHIFGVVLLVANGGWWESLSASQRVHVAAAARRASDVQRQASIDDDRQLLDQLVGDGVEVLPADLIDMDAFRDAGASCAARLRGRLPQDLCEAYLQT